MAAVTSRWSTRADVLGLEADISLSGSAAVPPSIREALAWAVMEAMQNCAKHSGQRTVQIRGPGTRVVGSSRSPIAAAVSGRLG